MVADRDRGREEEERAVDIELAPQRIFALKDKLSAEEVRVRAMDRRATAISSGIGGLLQRPKPDDIALLASQRRVEPFWHVAGKARYVYERTREYTVPPSSPEVRTVEFGGTTYEVADGKGGKGFRLEVKEHCREDIADELFVDALTASRRRTRAPSGADRPRRSTPRRPWPPTARSSSRPSTAPRSSSASSSAGC